MRIWFLIHCRSSMSRPAPCRMNRKSARSVGSYFLLRVTAWLSNAFAFTRLSFSHTCSHLKNSLNNHNHSKLLKGIISMITCKKKRNRRVNNQCFILIRPGKRLICVHTNTLLYQTAAPAASRGRVTVSKDTAIRPLLHAWAQSSSLARASQRLTEEINSYWEPEKYHLG